MKCSECKIDYPHGLVQTMCSSEGNKNLCGICALEFSNKIHGTKRSKFNGPIAEKMRQAAIEFRRKMNEKRND